jgi:hypothetical protein
VHPRIEAWLAFVDDRDASVDRDRLRAHLESCPDCRALAEDARRMRAALESDRLLAPSAAAREAAFRAFRPAPTAPRLPDWTRGLPERAADLVFDSFAESGPAFAGARSAGLARRVRFESGGLELDALIEPHGDRRRLTAQVLRLNGAARPVASAAWVVSVGERVEGEGRTDESGELSREIAGAGEIQIRVAAAAGELTVFRIPPADTLR